MDYQKVKEHKHLLRDPESTHIMNTDSVGYQQYMARRAAKASEKKKATHVEGDLDVMKTDLDNLKGEISEIKSLLKELVSNVN